MCGYQWWWFLRFIWYFYSIYVYQITQLQQLGIAKSNIDMQTCNQFRYWASFLVGLRLLSPSRYKIPIWPYVFVARNIQGIRPTLLIAVTSFPHNESGVHTHSLSVWFEIIAPFYLFSAHLYAVVATQCATILYVKAPTAGCEPADEVSCICRNANPCGRQNEAVI